MSVLDWLNEKMIFKRKLFEQAKELEKQQIKDAYNQGYREGLQDYYLKDEFKDVSEYSNAENYYNETFNK
jgi:HEPN domain-containing protein